MLRTVMGTVEIVVDGEDHAARRARIEQGPRCPEQAGDG